jgi:WXG100 family type VII secretion target
MDVDAVDAAAKQLKQTAGHLDDIVNAIGREVGKLASAWSGADAQRFVNSEWPKHKANLVSIQQSIHGLSRSAANNASEQRQASGMGAGSTAPAPQAHSAPAGPSLPVAGQTAPGTLAAWNEGAYRGFESHSHPSGRGYDVDANGKAINNCTAWAAWRREELGLSAPSGNGGEMAGKIGGTTGTPPSLGALVSDTTAGYGHVMVIEQVYPDGSFRVSETNYAGSTAIKSDRVWTPLPDGTWRCRQDGQVRDLVIAP